MLSKAAGVQERVVLRKAAAGQTKDSAYQTSTNEEKDVLSKSGKTYAKQIQEK